jgi:catechol 2,3-dioxygenase-like lactoylglutathione lyase family enzyme
MSARARFHIKHVALPSSDIETSVRFFQTFGFETGFSKLDESGQLDLQQMGCGSCFVELIRTESTPQASGWHLGLSVDDIAFALDILAKEGLFPMGPVRRGVSGVDYVFFKDPSGNLIEITAAVP